MDISFVYAIKKNYVVAVKIFMFHELIIFHSLSSGIFFWTCISYDSSSYILTFVFLASLKWIPIREKLAKTDATSKRTDEIEWIELETKFIILFSSFDYMHHVIAVVVVGQFDLRVSFRCTHNSMHFKNAAHVMPSNETHSNWQFCWMLA